MSIEETRAQTQPLVTPRISGESSAVTQRAEAALSPAAQRRLAPEENTFRVRLRKFNRRFFKGNPLNMLGVAIIIVFLILTAFGQRIAETRGAAYSPTAPSIHDRLEGPSMAHWFGTDDLGRDVFSRVLSGAKYSLGVAAIILLIAVTTGVLIGAVAGFFGGIVDELLMRLTDMFLAFPALILAIAISASLGPNLRNAVIDCHGLLALVCAAGARAGADDQKPRFRGSSALGGRRQRPAAAAPHHAQRHQRDRDPDDAGRRLRRAGDLVAVVHRPRRAAAIA